MKRNSFIGTIALILCTIIFSGCVSNMELSSDALPSEPLIEETVNGGLDDYTVKTFCTILYKNAANGRIEGKLEQEVKLGESGEEVVAIPDGGYVFAGWSDGLELAARRDDNVSEDITVHPNFMKIGDEFTVKYEVRRGTALVERVKKTGIVGEGVSYTPPEAPLGYVYGEWSDGKEGGRRTDSATAATKIFTIQCKPLSLGVPTIEITTNDGAGITERENYKACRVSLSNTYEEDCFENVSAQIRGRGNSSWSYPKKGFNLKFDKKRTMLGSDYKSKTWVFISNYGDKSLIRNMIGYDMSDAFHGLDFTVKHEFIDVYLNGEYYGLFMITDKIDVGDGKIDLNKTISPDPAQTAYIVEIGDTTPGVQGVDYVRIERDRNYKYCLNFPETDDPAYDPDVHLAYIADYIDRCLAALSAQDWELICELIDIDSFIDHYIIQEMFMNKDGFWRSIYFYKAPGGKLYAGPVWDLDQGAGNVDGFYGTGAYDTHPSIDISYVNTEYSKQDGTGWIAGVNTWYRRLMRNDEFVELLRARIAEYGPIIEELLKKLSTDDSDGESYYAIYKDAMERNFERWDIMGVSVWPNTPKLVEIDTVKGQIDYVREWLTERYKVLCELYKV